MLAVYDADNGIRSGAIVGIVKWTLVIVAIAILVSCRLFKVRKK